MTVRQRAQPVFTPDRITNLDAIRGIAVLGILAMNAVSYGLPMAAYFNLAAAGSESWLDWVIGITGAILIDQKMMGLFSMLFGAGIALFADRAARKTGYPGLLSLWRNVLLFGIGLLHWLLWDGDVLVIYALCAPLIIVLRNLPPRLLMLIGTTAVLGSALHATLLQGTVSADGASLGNYWWADGHAMSDAVGVFLLNDFFGRAFGMMLIGVALYRLGILNGTRPTAFYRRMACAGLMLGLPLAGIGVIVQAVNHFVPQVALIGRVPNTLATIPVVLGYVGLITLWNQRSSTPAHERVHAVGRMALTNYLTQTLLGIIVLRGIFTHEDLGRTGIALFVVAVCAVQLVWSKAWLERFRFGPIEWLWRCATYRKRQPFKQAIPTDRAVADVRSRYSPGPSASDP